MENIKQQRNSSIETLKILAVMMIILCHSVPDGDIAIHESAIDFFQATTNIQLIVARYIYNLGSIGNNIFIVCAAWFLVDSHKIRRNKIVGMIGDCVFISVCFLIFFLLIGYKLPIYYLIKQLFPVSFGNCWFLTCYLLLYIIHPLLNCVVHGTRKEVLLGYNICFFVLYNCMGFLMENTLFYYSNIVGFVGIYFFVAYIKLYLPECSTNIKLNIQLLILGITGWIVSTEITEMVGLNISSFKYLMVRWSNIMNPCYILIAIASFNLFKSKTFRNVCINYISSLSLLIYMIHTTRIMRDYARYDIWGYIKMAYGYDNLLIEIFLFALFNLFVGTTLAIIYNKTIQKYVHLLFEKGGQIVFAIYNYISRKLLCLK